jgi:hypothetical protein
MLITMSDIPLSEEGLYGFELAIGDQTVKLKVLVGLVPKRAGMDVQKRDMSITAFEPAPRPSRRDVN